MHSQQHLSFISVDLFSSVFSREANVGSIYLGTHIQSIPSPSFSAFFPRFSSAFNSGLLCHCEMGHEGTEDSKRVTLE